MRNADYIEIQIGDSEKSERREQPELILDILECVPFDGVGNVDQISKTANTRWSTTRKYLELIAVIQAAPKLRVYRMKGSHKKVYRRDEGQVPREIVT